MVRIEADLYEYYWYDELVQRMLAELNAYLARRAAFAEYLANRAVSSVAPSSV